MLMSFDACVTALDAKVMVQYKATQFKRSEWRNVTITLATLQFNVFPPKRYNNNWPPKTKWLSHTNFPIVANSFVYSFILYIIW